MSGPEIFAYSIIGLAIVAVFMGITTVRQGYEYTIERFGRYRVTLRPGLHVIVPFMDRVGHKINMMERVADVPSQLAKQLQRAAAPPPAGFPPGPPDDVAVSPLRVDDEREGIRAERHRDVVGLSLAGERVVLVSDPKVAADVMIDRAGLFVKEGTAFFPGSSLAGEGLLVSDGESWARQRRLSNPAFRAAAVDAYATAMARALSLIHI